MTAMGSPVGVQVLGITDKELSKICRSNRQSTDVLKAKMTLDEVERRGLSSSGSEPRVWASLVLCAELHLGPPLRMDLIEDLTPFVPIGYFTFASFEYRIYGRSCHDDGA